MNILLTSAGRRGYLVNYFKEALENQGEIHVANSSIHSTAMMYGDHSVVTPLIYDDAYIPFLKAYCKEHHIDALIPLFDIDLPILSNYKTEFRRIGVEIIVSNKEVIAICNDKWETCNYLKKKGFHTALTFVTLPAAINAIRQGHICFPLIIKPRWGMGSISIFEAENMDELNVLYHKVEKTIQATYLSYESQQNIKSCVVIQEKLVGQEYGLDIINDLEGNYQTTIVKKKRAMRAGETDCAETVINLELETMGKRLSLVMGHTANLDVDAFIVEGVPYILEMNARFGGGYPFSHIAGVNLPKAIIHWLNGEAVEQSLLVANPGVVAYKSLMIIEHQTNAVPVVL
ncbi:ATP-grasp domain-containing protein [Sporosarcina sp. E16_8]|uniref:ATP-grasp domain-containing protein n=1 Tax=Sporosarcina sp. E16_8 TaxID=2789295 RepID=UPI001A9152BC|nr:ATP-grasp domain-containing protein [Sporosarcina sp. E16_8]